MLLHHTSHGFSEESPSNDEWRPAKNQHGSPRLPDWGASVTSFQFSLFHWEDRFFAPSPVATRKHFSSSSRLGEKSNFQHRPIKHHGGPGLSFSCFTCFPPRGNRNILVWNRLLEATMHPGVMDARVSRSRRIRVHGLGTIPTFGLSRPHSNRPSRDAWGNGSGRSLTVLPSAGNGSFKCS
jgi:hypothetical protein